MTANVSTANLYGAEFFEAHLSGALQSAREVVPLVMKTVHPRSVVDVGCGTGAWLSAFADAGVEEYLGVDQAWVHPESLLIPRERFQTHDLEQPLTLPRRFDLVMSVEVAEHLAPECAAAFVHGLTSLGPVVLFSAAIPGQGGVHHVNEQWPGYWAALFAAEGYQPVDALRLLIWNNHRVEWWYQQNLMLYVQAGQLPALGLTAVPVEAGCDSLTRIHPEQYRKVLGKYEALRQRNEVGRWPLRKLLKAVPGALLTAVRRAQ